MAKAKAKLPVIDAFGFRPGRVLAGKYEVVSCLGAGWEGEVYLIRERVTGIERTAKIFFPQRNVNGKTSRFYDKKLHALRQCPVVIQYHTQDTVTYKGLAVPILVSEFVEGELLSRFIERQPGKRLSAFPAMHLLHALASGIECIHRMGEYHGDLHMDNIMVQRFGLGFDLKLLDLFHWSAPKKANIQQDVFDLIRIFYDALGGQKYYARQPQEIKAIISGLKRSLITRKFKSAGQLREYLETMEWS